MEQGHYHRIKEYASKFAGWAIWDEDNIKNTQIVEENIESLHSKYVIIGLNISAPFVDDWGNFRLGKNDIKLLKLFNKDPFRGSYMTDLIKNIPNPDSKKIETIIGLPEVVKLNQEFLENEFELIGVNKDTTFILLGDLVKKNFHLYSQSRYETNKIIFLNNHGYRYISPEEWDEVNRKRLNLPITTEKQSKKEDVKKQQSVIKSEQSKLYLEIWLNVLDQLKGKTEFFQDYDNRKYGPFILSGRNHCFYTLEVTQKLARVKIDFKSPDIDWNLDALNRMKAYDSEIQERFGHKLIWHPGKSLISWVGVEKGGFNIFDDKSRLNMVDYIVLNFLNLEKILKEYLVKNNLLY